MIIFVSAVALATVQPAVQTPAAPSSQGEAMAHRNGHCCCCDHGDRDREGCADHAQHRGHDSHD